jgi:hypothetical protein
MAFSGHLTAMDDLILPKITGLWAFGRGRGSKLGPLPAGKHAESDGEPWLIGATMDARLNG